MGNQFVHAKGLCLSHLYHRRLRLPVRVVSFDSGPETGPEKLLPNLVIFQFVWSVNFGLVNRLEKNMLLGSVLTVGIRLELPG